MLDTIGCVASKDLAKENIRSLIKELEGNGRFAETIEALNSMVTALNYNDKVLLEYGLNKAFQGVASAAETGISRRENSVRLIRESLPKFWSLLEDCPPEAFQTIGNELRSFFDNSIVTHERARDALIKNLRDRGYEVNNSDRLDWIIGELREMKAEVLKDWPWEDRPLPPVDRGMVARARASKNGLRVEDLIRTFEGDSTK